MLWVVIYIDLILVELSLRFEQVWMASTQNDIFWQKEENHLKKQLLLLFFLKERFQQQMAL